MYSVMIADDNAKVCSNIKALILDMFPDLQIQSIHYDGDSLLRAIQAAPPDILLCDIEMPGKSGIEICKYLYQHKLPTRVILITAYRKFEYAKGALDYKVTTFLTKPYTSAQMREALQAAIFHLDRTVSEKAGFSPAQLVNFEYIKLIVETLYASRQLSGRLPYVLAGSTPMQECNVIEWTFRSEAEISFGERLDTDSPELTVCTLKDGLQTKCVLFLRENAPSAKAVADLKASLPKGDITLDQSDTLSFPAWVSYRKLQKLSSLLVNAIEYANIPYFLKSNQTQLESLSYPDLSRLFEYTFRTVVDGGAYTFTPTPGADLLSVLIAFDDYVFASQKSASTISKIKLYIAEHHTNSYLSLQDIADTFHLTSKYLSAYFKNKTGIALTQYVNDIRVSHARHLLAEQGSLSIEAVAKAVGFNDAKYFQRIFKKFTGQTPYAYRKKIKKHEKV